VRELSDPITIGTVTTPHGVSGTLRVRAAGSGRHLREGVEPLVGGKRRRILKCRPTPKGFLVDLEGIESREAAGRLRGEDLLLDRAELDEPGEDEFYTGDLVGLEVLDGSGDRLGVVEETFETPAHEVLVIRSENGEIYLPFTLEHVPEVDLRRGFIVARPPEEG
jgi:16S rRNA processing protein RimM